MASSSSSQLQDANTETSEEPRAKDLLCYLPLQKATLKGDWKSAKRFFDLDSNATTANITSLSDSILHIAVGTGDNLQFLTELLKFMNEQELVQRDKDGDTALAYAAVVGNTEAAKMLVSKNSDLTQMKNSEGMTPLHQSAQYGHKETLLYLLSVTREDKDPYPFTGKLGVRLLNYVIVAGFYDVALDIVSRYPELAKDKDESGEGPLDKLAEMPSPFASWNRLPFWRRFIYAWYQRSQILDSDIIKQKAPCLKQIHHTKLMREHYLPLVKYIIAQVKLLENSEVMNSLYLPILKAAEIGSHEIITECAKYYPSSIWFYYEKSGTIFHVAVSNRRLKVFNLIYQMSAFKHIITKLKDGSNNNLLHLAAKLAPSSELNSVPGAALQMQRELQWYKEVENLLQPSYKEMANGEGKTPKMIFTEEHETLVKKGEKWMKDTATSCMVVDTLIATVMFAAIFTVPGGNRGDEGIPIFLNDKAFMVFAMSDGVALFSSLTSVLMFLSILTSHYAEEDFLYSLPNKLIIGLTTLFISIASMMIAFGATLFIVLSQKIAWISIPVSLLACVPVILYGSLQFPHLVAVVRSTYWRSMFQKKHKDILY